MAITLKVTGNGRFAGAETNLSGYSVQEFSTPIDPSDSSGGTGSSTFRVMEDTATDGTILLLRDTVELEDGSNGRTRGTVSRVSSDNGSVSVSAESRLNLLVSEMVVPPFSGTLQNALLFYFSLGGITEGFVIDPTIGARLVSYPGWSGDLWTGVKRLCVAQQIEISLVSSNIVARPLRTREVNYGTDSDMSWEVSVPTLAQTIEIYCYNNKATAGAVVYPLPATAEDNSPNIIQVAADQTLVSTLVVNASLSTVSPPSAVPSIDPGYVGSTSAYTVIDKDDVLVTPVEWYAGGGFIDAVLGENTNEIVLTVHGSTDINRAPYRIAMPIEDGVTPALFIAGAGVTYQKELITIPTGASPDEAPEVVGITIDNPFISTLAEAYTAGLIAAGKWSGAEQTISAVALVINRKGDNGSTVYPTFSDFNSGHTGKTFAQLTTELGSKTFSMFTADYFAAVADDFENQAFGNVSGSRVRFRGCFYRIRSSTVSHDTINYSGERDTLFSDFNAVWAGATFADFNASMTGKTFADYGVIPLWR